MFILFFINSKPLEEETHPLLPKISNLIVVFLKNVLLMKSVCFKVVKFALQFVFLHWIITAASWIGEMEEKEFFNVFLFRCLWVI